MAYNDCVNEIAKANGMTPQDAESILQSIDQDAERLERESNGVLDLIGAYRQSASDAHRAAQAVAARERYAKLRNVQKRLRRRAEVEARFQEFAESFEEGAFTSAGARRGKASALFHSLRNELFNYNTPSKMGKMSAEARIRTLQNAWTSELTRDLDHANLYRAARNPTMARLWGKELFELSKRDAGEPANVGVTGNKEALKIAEIIRNRQNTVRMALNHEGAWIGNYAGYISRTSHDPNLLLKAGWPAWRDFITPLLDERTFDGVENREQFLRNVYIGLKDGIHLSDSGRIGFKDPAFHGPANMAKRLSQERVLHFKDADGWLDYQAKFGSYGNNLLMQVMNSFSRAARQKGLMEKFGTNPRAEFSNDVKYFEQKFRTVEDDSAAAFLKRRETSLDTVFDHLDGSADMPVNQLGAKIGKYSRTIESMSKLGLVGFTHLSSVTTKAQALTYHGINFGEAYGNGMMSLLRAFSSGRGRGSGEMKLMADRLLAGMEGMNADLIHWFQFDDTIPGTLSNIQNTFFKATGLTNMVNAQKTGVHFVMARHLGDMVDREFDALPAETQRDFEMHGISKADWDALRSAPDQAKMDGRVFLVPDAAYRTTADLSEFARQELGMKLHAYYSNVADEAIITPGVAEKSLFLNGNRPGTLIGEVLRYIMQFKQWPAAMIRQGFGRAIYGNATRPAQFAGVMHIMVGATIMGTLIAALKDVMKGKSPRPWDDPATWLAGFAQGGGGGIFGDYLFGQASRFGESPAETIAGPVLGQTAGKLFDIWNTLKDSAVNGDVSKAQDALPKMEKLVENNLPFVNLPFIRNALDYLVLWNLQEAMSPGFQKRYERRVKRDTGQTFWLSPAQAVQ